MSIVVEVILYGLGLLLLSLCLLLVKQLAEMVQVFGVFKKYGIPGPKPNPLWGHLWKFRGRDDPNELLDEWLDKYGDVFGYFMGSRPHLVINDVDLIKEIMVRQSSRFRNRTPLCINVLPLCRSLLAAEDQEWKAQRRVLGPAFSPSKVRLMTNTVNQCVDLFLEQVGQLTEGKERHFEVYRRVQALTLDVISRCALAMKLDCQRDPDGCSFFRAVREYFDLCENAAVHAALIFPPLARAFGFLNDHLSAGKMTDSIVSNLRKVIADRRGDGHKRTDLLQLMLDAAEESKMDEYFAIANAHFFLLAGYETTSTALVFMLYLLAKHQDVQQRLYLEVQDLPDAPGYDEVFGLQYLDQVLSESMRLYPPVTLFITRQCTEEWRIGDLTVPKNVILQVPVWRIHHDPRHYPDPWTFDPDRFSPDRKDLLNPYAYLPFGVGPRNCLGMRFALLEEKLVVARLIKNYRICLSDRTEDPLKLSCPTVISYPKNGVYITAERRLRKSNTKLK